MCCGHLCLGRCYCSHVTDVKEESPLCFRITSKIQTWLVQVIFLSVNLNYLSFSFRPTLFSSHVTWISLSPSNSSASLWMASTAREHPPPSLRYFCCFSFLNICFFEMTLTDMRPKSGDVLWVELTFISVCRAVLGSDPYWRLAWRNEARAYETICILTQLIQNKYVLFSLAGINKQYPLCSARLFCAALRTEELGFPVQVSK